MKPLVWLTGRDGALGSELLLALAGRGFSCYATGRECDVSINDEVARFGDGRQFGWIVNCGAYTNVDKAEIEPEAAMATNVQGALNLAEFAISRNANYVHFSSDYVFDGRNPVHTRRRTNRIH